MQVNNKFAIASIGLHPQWTKSGNGTATALSGLFLHRYCAKNINCCLFKLKVKDHNELSFKINNNEMKNK